MRAKVLSLLPFLLLAGCAGNAIRLEAAGAVQRDARAAVASSARYFDAVEERRRAAAAALVASDPSCLPLSRLRIQVPLNPAAPPAPLCLADGVPAPGHTAFAIDIADSPRLILEPRIALLAAVADYADALAAILDAPNTDVAAELTAFADQATRVARFANVAAGTDIPGIDQAAASEQGQSLIALIAFASDLAREANDVRKVRALVVERGQAVDRALAALAIQVDVWGRGAARTADDLYGNALFRSYLNGRADLSAAQREDLAARVFAARAAARDGPARADAVKAAIDLAATAQGGLRDALAGRFTPAQRRAAARLNLDRITRALGLVASLGAPL